VRLPRFLDIRLWFRPRSALPQRIESEIRLMLEPHVGDANAEALWALVRGRSEDILFAFWQDGSLAGNKSEEAFFVRCDPTTILRTTSTPGVSSSSSASRPSGPPSSRSCGSTSSSSAPAPA
jgi:hypothetical protein